MVVVVVVVVVVGLAVMSPPDPDPSFPPITFDEPPEPWNGIFSTTWPSVCSVASRSHFSVSALTHLRFNVGCVLSGSQISHRPFGSDERAFLYLRTIDNDHVPVDRLGVVVAS